MMLKVGEYRMERQIKRDLNNTMKNKWLPITSVASGRGEEIVPGLFYYTNQIVNICCICHPTQSKWLLIDTGMPESADEIENVVVERFGKGNKPSAIILTHGHFDHVGSIVDFVQRWKVPVYAHPLELPFLTGKKTYPAPHASIEDGLVSALSPLFPNEPVDLGNFIKILPERGIIPDFPDWQWIHTPGHTPGHISLFRSKDHALIAGDAFVTVKQESLFKVLSQYPEISGPPKYFTMDWQASKKSVEKLAKRNPKVAVTGHGPPIANQSLSDGLKELVDHFEQIALPIDQQGRYPLS